jgi:transposase
MLMRAFKPMLTARRALTLEYANLEKVAMDFARHDDVCQQFMTAPGVGPIVVLTYRAPIYVLQRFRRSRPVGAHLGRPPRANQSGEVDWNGRVSKSGDAMAQAAFYEAAHFLLNRVKGWWSLKAWARGWRRTGSTSGITALALWIAVLLHRTSVRGATFIWKKDEGVAITLTALSPV